MLFHTCGLNAALLTGRHPSARYTLIFPCEKQNHTLPSEFQGTAQQFTPERSMLALSVSASLFLQDWTCDEPVVVAASACMQCVESAGQTCPPLLHIIISEKFANDKVQNVF